MFLLVGLASASICLWLIFAVRRRRKRRRLEHEAVLAAPNGHRSPLADEDDDDATAGLAWPRDVDDDVFARAEGVGNMCAGGRQEPQGGQWSCWQPNQLPSSGTRAVLGN